MTVKTVMAKLAPNKEVLVKRSLIVAGTVVGIVLTAGLIAKNKTVIENALEPAIDAITDLTA